MTLPLSADQLIARARKTTQNEVGMCLWQSQEWYGSPHLFASAAKQWKGAKHRHPGDRNPPRGAHVMWTGGRHGFGHSAIYVGDGKIRTIDMPRSGVTSEVSLDAPEQKWGLTYAGWTEDIGGVRIPWLIPGAVINAEAAEAPTNPFGVKVGDTAVVITVRAPLLGRTSPAGPASGVERDPGFTFVVTAVQNGWASGGHNWYSTDYLFPQIKPDPGNPNKLGKDARARVTAAGGLRARRFPGGPPSTDKNGLPIIRSTGWELTITEDPVDGWVTGGHNWYSSDFLAVAPIPPQAPSKPHWTGPSKTLVVSEMAGSVTYLQSLVRVAAVANDAGHWPERYVMAQDPGKRGDTRFVLFDAAGRPLEEMTVLAGGHGQTFHAYRSAAGNLWIWTLIGDRAYRIQWQSGARITAQSVNVELADHLGRRPVGTYEPFIGFRGATGTQETFSLHNRHDFVAGRTQPIREVTIAKRTNMAQQSWALTDQRIYRLMGATNKNPPQGARAHILDVFDWTGRLLHDRVDLTPMSVSTTSDEPEGLTFTENGAVDVKQLLVGKREGGSKPNRSYPIWTMTGV